MGQRAKVLLLIPLTMREDGRLCGADLSIDLRAVHGRSGADRRSVLALNRADLGPPVTGYPGKSRQIGWHRQCGGAGTGGNEILFWAPLGRGAGKSCAEVAEKGADSWATVMKGEEEFCTIRQKMNERTTVLVRPGEIRILDVVRKNRDVDARCDNLHQQ